MDRLIHKRLVNIPLKLTERAEKCFDHNVSSQARDRAAVTWLRHLKTCVLVTGLVKGFQLQEVMDNIEKKSSSIFITLNAGLFFASSYQVHQALRDTFHLLSQVGFQSLPS